MGDRTALLPVIDHPNDQYCRIRESGMKKILEIKGGKLFALFVITYLSIPLWDTGLQKDLVQFIQWYLLIPVVVIGVGLLVLDFSDPDQ